MDSAVAATPISGIADQAKPSPAGAEIKPDSSALPVGYESAKAGANGAASPQNTTNSGQEPGSLTNSVVHQAEPAPSASVTATSVGNPPGAGASAESTVSSNAPPVAQPTSEPAVAAVSADIKPEIKTTSDVKLPTGFALTAEGETWQDVARRVLGDEKFADQLWKENRDRHDGGFEARPLANHLIRVPKIDGRGSTASQIASKSP